MANMNLEAKDFGYSLKNIPIPTKSAYMKCLVEKVESLLIRMRWKMKFSEVENRESNKDKVTNYYGFKSKNMPPQNDLLKLFEEDLLTLVRNVEFKQVKEPFMNKLREDVKMIADSKDVFVFADKTRNLYPIAVEDYKKVLKENVTKCYKKTKSQTVNDIDEEAADIAVDLKLEGRMECYAKKEAFVTFKDHKDNFLNHPKCRLINPAKSEIGKISKRILENINKQVRGATKLLQWRNSGEVIQWFEGRKQGKQCKFVQFDICEFYPSITENLLKISLDFAASFCKIEEKERHIILNARKSLLFSADEEWIRKKSNGEGDIFDVTMGCYDGAEVCEIVGLFLLNEIRKKLGNADVGLYRDDGLAIFPKLSGRQSERIKQELVAIFKNNGLKITIDTNLKIVNFLDVTFNLINKTYYPYRKPNNTPLYINKNSNHPPTVIKQLPSMINRRISEISCNESEFNKAKNTYQGALKECGYDVDMEYKKYKSTKKYRKRKIMYFNPPYSLNVKTNIGKQFLQLIDKHFPPQHKCHKLFNRKNLKVSYCCMPNMEKILKGHNSDMLKVKNPEKRNCNCRIRRNCPLNGECLTKCVVYTAEVKVDKDSKIYYGSCNGPFKERFNNHTKSFKNKKYCDETKLSQFIWKMKEKKKKLEISWSILKKCRPYRAGARRCDLCLTEKLAIIQGNEKKMINKRSEIANKCRHYKSFSYSRILEKRIL